MNFSPQERPSLLVLTNHMAKLKSMIERGAFFYRAQDKVEGNMVTILDDNAIYHTLLVTYLGNQSCLSKASVNLTASFSLGLDSMTY